MRNGRRDARPFVQCHAVLVLLASSANGHMIGAVDPFGSARPGARSSLSLVLLASAANGHIFDAAGPFGAAWPRASSTSREVKEPLAIDPVSYRSSSQGPRMVDEENEPALAEMDEVISRALRVGTTQPIIPQFPDAKSVLTIWKGTIIEQVWRSVALSMLAPTLLILGVRSLGIPDEAHPLIAILTAVHAGWNYQLTLSTFVVTFFVGQSYLFWKNAYALTRRVQGRMNDLGMLSAAHAAHGPDGKLSPDSEQLLTDLARNLRLVHLLFWADVLYRRTRAFGAPFRVLLSDAGLVRLTQRGLMTERELSVLREARLPPARWYMLVLQWYLTRLTMAMQAGLLVGGAGLENLLMHKTCELRAALMSIPDELAARMPLSYVHFTHFLVDSLLLLAPFALYPKTGFFSVFVTGVMTLFYKGLLELSKSFLDPFGNKRVSSKFMAADLEVDVLLAESNAGSLVWPMGAAKLPFDIPHSQPPPATKLTAGLAPPGLA